MNVHRTAVLPTGDIPVLEADALSFIETQFPVGRVSAEAYKERKAGSGQTLTALGSYWKGRKPLIMVRASILGCLLPATSQPLADLRVFLLLMGMEDASFSRRIKAVKPADIDISFNKFRELVDNEQRPAWRRGITAHERERLIRAYLGHAGEMATKTRIATVRPGDIDKHFVQYDDLMEYKSYLGWNEDLTESARDELIGEWLSTLAYDKRLAYALRPEEAREDLIDANAWAFINAHLGTRASSIEELVLELGEKRFGRRPVVCDTFAGAGSIPFEASRMGCDAQASDLNPIACMLNWGAANIVGGSQEQKAEFRKEQERVALAIKAKMDEMRLEIDINGNQAKSYLYCMETTCPKTGWIVPILPSLVLSEDRSIIAELAPDQATKSYRITIKVDVTPDELASAGTGTFKKGRLIHPMNPDKEGVAISVIRGDYKGADGIRNNRLRLWEADDYKPRPDDIWQERLYAIQWITRDTIGKGRLSTFFSAVTEDDLAREIQVENLLAKHLKRWQDEGFVPNMPIATGKENEGPIRTNGWTYWHHMFTPRQLLSLALIAECFGKTPLSGLIVAKCADYSNKSSQWRPRNEYAEQLFSGPSLKTQFSWAARSCYSLIETINTPFSHSPITGKLSISNVSAAETVTTADLFVTDPPYADSVRYEEITEFFIAWLRRHPPAQFAGWVWDSRRPLAIKGNDEKFRSDMVASYRNMANRMPNNGMQVVMFTHQDAGIWADLASIMWAAGLRVTAAWNVVTETESALKEGNYVQGTILLVLRKRLTAGNIKRMDIEGEIEEAVDHQLATLNSLDDDWTSERLYTDGDLQLAAYAAALRVITGYATIDRKEVGADVYRKLAKGEKTVIRELIEYAASVANNKLVPDGFAPVMWRDLDAPSRFYVRMLDMESKGTTKFADYQDFARTFSVADYADLMDSTKANAASLAGAGALKGRMLGGKGFGSSPLRRVLFAVYKTMQKDDPREGLAFLKTELGQDYWMNRAKLVVLAKYVSAKTARTRPIESSAADLLAQRLEVDKV